MIISSLRFATLEICWLRMNLFGFENLRARLSLFGLEMGMEMEAAQCCCLCVSCQNLNEVQFSRAPNSAVSNLAPVSLTSEIFCLFCSRHSPCFSYASVHFAGHRIERKLSGQQATLLAACALRAASMAGAAQATFV